MSEFKVGDKVRCVDFTNSISLTHGVVYVVQGVNKNNFIRVSLGELYWNPDKFELVEEGLEEELEEVTMTELKNFDEMSLKEKEELISAYLRGEEILYSTNETGDVKVLGTYASKGTVLFTHLHYYKIKKEELDIPWEYIDSKYKYAVKGMGDIVLVSTHKPIYDKLTEYWSVPEGSLRNLPEPFTIKNLDKIKPEESLVERPNDE